MTVLYFDCFSGAAGDMILGALIDAGAPVVDIEEAIAHLPIERVEVRHHQAQRAGITATAIEVRVPEQADRRTYRDIREMLTSSSLEPRVRERSLQAFEILAEAESRIHGTPVDDIHFHEVGSLDAIADVVGAMTAIEHFSPELVVSSPIAIGHGSVQTEHGQLPVPVPAVTEILRGALLRPGGEGEVITPTGAAILKTVCDRFDEVPPMRLTATGYGAGTRDLVTPNVLRVLVGESSQNDTTSLLLLETNVDDMNPELVPYVIESVMRVGALDAWSAPIVGKKGRVAVTITALIEPDRRDRALDVLYRETTTLGVRIVPITRDALERDWLEVQVEGQSVRVKVARRGSEIVTIAPEYEDAAKAARATGLPLKEVYARASEQARSLRRL